MDKQIEEMAKVLCINDNFQCNTCPSLNKCFNYSHAKKLYNALYRKIPEGAVVLTREEYEECEKCKDLLKQYVDGELINEDIFVQQVEDLKQARKETAEKYHAKVNEAIDSVPNATKEFVEAWKAKNDEICKELEGEK